MESRKVALLNVSRKFRLLKGVSRSRSNVGQKWYQSKALIEAHHQWQFFFTFIKGKLCNLQKNFSIVWFNDVIWSSQYNMRQRLFLPHDDAGDAG